MNLKPRLTRTTCTESVSLDESTLGNEDAEVPEPGEVFLYMAEYDDGERSSFGTVGCGGSTRMRRGVCPR